MLALFLESYWPAIATAIVAGAVWWSGNQRTNARLKWTALGVLGLAAALALLSVLIVTDREKVIARTHQLVERIEAMKFDDLRPLLHPQLRIDQWQGPDDLIKGGKNASRQFTSWQLGISRVQADARQGEVIVRLSIKAEAQSSQGAGTVLSDWQLVWVPGDGGWQLYEVQCTDVPFYGAEAITSRFRTRP